MGRIWWNCNLKPPSRFLGNPKYISLILLLLVSFWLSVHEVKTSYRNFLPRIDCQLIPVDVQPSLNPGAALVKSLQKAREVVSDTTVTNKSAAEDSNLDEVHTWNQHHHCGSRGPFGLLSLYNRSDFATDNIVPVSPLWHEVFEEYSKLHRACMRRVSNVRDYFLRQDTSSGCKFLVADVSKKAEFGEKILDLASSLLYAVLTQRVILIPESTLVPSYVCEPFVGSSWLLNSTGLPLPPASFKADWEFCDDDFREMDRNLRPCAPSLISGARQAYAAAITPRGKFFYTDGWDVLSQTPFIHLSGHGYAVPMLFASPAFRPTLEALFPDKIAITRLLRSAFLPANRVWRRVRARDHGYVKPADRRVGVHLRFDAKGIPTYKKMNEKINKRVTECLIRNDILPDYHRDWRHEQMEGHGQEPEQGRLRLSSTEPAMSTQIVRVVVSSISLALKDHLAGIYDVDPSTTGESVGVVQVSRTGSRELGVEQEIDDFEEALLLSFSDHLLITPMSDLGSVAHAYGGLSPWFIEVRRDGWIFAQTACERGKTIEVCSHISENLIRHNACASRDGVDGNSKQQLEDMAPYMEKCRLIGRDVGIQMITSSRPQT